MNDIEKLGSLWNFVMGISELSVFEIYRSDTTKEVLQNVDKYFEIDI